MTRTATAYSQPIMTVADEQLATNVLLVEWLVKLQQQLSRQQRQIEQQQQQIAAQQQEIEQLKEERDKLKKRNSKNSSVPPSSDQLTKPSDKSKRKKGKKRGPKYNHPGTTRNGFGTPDQIVTLSLENCPVCGTALELVEEAPQKVQPVAEVGDQPIEIREYRRPLYSCYCIDGIKYWLWVATSEQVCALMLAPTRSSAELEKLLGADFEGILSSDCFSAYSPQDARAKQKCLAYLERDLKALETSRFEGNREFASRVQLVLWQARSAYQDYQEGKLSRESLSEQRERVEASLKKVLEETVNQNSPSDTLRLSQRLQRHGDEWFTFLSHPEVKPDNNDAERALRPIVIHRKVSGGARSDWGAELVAQMFSFLETMRLQGSNAITQLCELLSLSGRSPPGLEC